MDGFPVIKTARLLMRNFTDADVPAFFDIFSREEVTEHYGCYSYTHIIQAEEQVKRKIEVNEKGGKVGFRWALVLNDSSQHYIGSCGFHSVNEHTKAFKIGYEIHPVHWRKGYAYEAVISMLQYCFEQDFPFAVNRVSATTDIYSPASISLLQKMGFTEEGILREYGYWRDQFHSVRLFSLLRREWEKKYSYSSHP